MAVRWGRVAQFYAVAVAGISLAAGALAVLGEGAGTFGPTMIAAVAMFSPLVATVVVNRAHGEAAFANTGARPRLTRWIAVASALGLVTAILTLFVGLALPGTSLDWEMNALYERFGASLTPEQLAEARAQTEALPVHPVFLALPQAIVAGLTINAVFAFGEEVGWRGFLQHELRGLGFWRGSLVTGTLWGLWHAPLILMGHNYPTQRIPGVFLFTVVCIGLSTLHSWVRLRGGTVWTAAVLHGTFNAAGGLSMIIVAGGELVVGVQGVAGVIALGMLNLGLAAIRPGRGGGTD